MLGFVFRLNCLSHLRETGLAAMRAVQFHPQKALCQERSESGHRSLTVPLGSQEKAATGRNCAFAFKKKILTHMPSFSLAARSELILLSPGHPAVPGARWRSQGVHHRAVSACWIVGTVGMGLKSCRNHDGFALSRPSFGCGCGGGCSDGLLITLTVTYKHYPGSAEGYPCPLLFRGRQVRDRCQGNIF